MAKVSLRIYNREIESMTEQGRIEEAVAHSQHILKKFPKHLDTYRMLGKAYLEAKRYVDAADIFSRVLMSVPNDFISHVGMSLIRDENNNMDDAIWHMERAFEAQPSNPAVQGELQRLYGRRDGVEPHKIRMTRGALAHMYVQGELYPQAIGEIQGVLAEDPDRVDMQVLLAKAYYRMGQRIDATEICSNLLKKYPYSLDANRILVEILPESNQPESTQVYRQRINALEPYSAFAKGSVFQSNDVPDAAVNLERLDWQPGQDSGLTSGWGDSIGIKLDEDAQPQWLQEDANALDPGSDPVKEAVSPAEEIPDFMRAAGWGDSSGEVEEGPLDFGSNIDSGDDVAEIEDIEQGEMPDWIKSMAPAAGVLAVDELTDAMDTGDTMGDDWLKNLQDDDEKKEPASDEIVSSSLSDLGTSADDQDAAMNWLESLAANQGANPDELITDPNARTENAPEWVEQAKDADATPPVAEEPVAAESEASVEESTFSGLGTSADDQDAAMNWLESLATNQSANPDELITDPNARTENAPEWVEQSKNADPAMDEPVELEETPLVGEPEAIVEEPSFSDLGTSADDQDAAMNWLESLAANQGANPDELITDPNKRTEIAPEWVEQSKNIDATSAVAEDVSVPSAFEPLPAETGFGDLDALSAEQPPAISDLPEDLNIDRLNAWQAEEPQEEIPVSVTEEPASNDGSVPDWLQDLESETSSNADNVAPSVDEEPIPDWLKEVKQADAGIEDPPHPSAEGEFESELPVPPPAVEPIPVPASQADMDLSAWLDDLKASDEQDASVPVEDDLPAWLQDETPPVEPQPTQQDDWRRALETSRLASESYALSEQESEPEQESAVPVEQTSPPAMETKAEAKPETMPDSSPAEPAVEKTSTRVHTTMLRDTALMGAQSALSEGNIKAALKEYDILIKKKRLLEETIHDLREALYDYPVDVSIWQTLGDAYMRANRLQDAIGAYTKAEELLR